MPGWPADSPTLRLRVPTGAAGASAAREAVLRHLADLPLPAQTVYRVELVLEELMMNAALHGGCTHADLAAAALPDAVALQIEDDGPPFDPTAAAPAVPAQTLDDARPGGLGLTLIRKAVREWHYERTAAGRNRVTALIARV